MLADGDSLQITTDFALTDAHHITNHFEKRPSSDHAPFSEQNVFDSIDYLFLS